MICTGLLLCLFLVQEMDMGRNYKTIIKKGKFGRNLLPNEGIKLRVVDKSDEDATIRVLFYKLENVKKKMLQKLWRK